MAAQNGGNGAATLSPPVRNRFFYGKLMDVRHFTMEQCYFLEQIRLLNRLGLGSGVLCGLEVAATADGKVVVRPGVAIDYRGREIVVTAPYCVEHPMQPTDDCGRPDGDPVEQGTVTLCLCYHECATEPTPVLVSDCDTQLDCQPSAIQERFRLLVHRGAPHDGPPHLSPEQCSAIFPEEPPEDFDRRRAACETLTGACAPFLDDCVVLATITAPGQGGKLDVDECTYRTAVYSNEMLLELILCLAARVDECCGKQAPPVTLPVVSAIWPKNAGDLSLQGGQATQDYQLWQKEPRLEVTFDRPMQNAELHGPGEWLRLFAAYAFQQKTRVRRLPLAFARLEPNPTLGVAGSTAVYHPDPAAWKKTLSEAEQAAHHEGVEIRFLVQIRSEDPATAKIHEAAAPGAALDADFRGTKLSAALLDTTWAVAAGTPQDLGQNVWTGLQPGPGALPSGDTVAGGRFHSFFTYRRDH